MDSKKKIHSLEKLTAIVEELRRNNKTIVTINGTFDILHVGHVFILEEAKKQGDVLIVGVNSDRSVKENKGPKRPLNSEQDRASMIAALASVDYVLIFDEKDPRTFLSVLKPHIHCNGSEYGKDCIEKEVVERNGGKIHIIHLREGYSSTRLIKKILESQK